MDETECVDPGVFGNDLTIFMIGALLQEVDNECPIWIEFLALQEFSQPGPQVVAAGPQETGVLNEDAVRHELMIRLTAGRGSGRHRRSAR
ncbi:hypothetical protein ACWDZ4_13630 [Streptomyces sp. NPDC003016]